MSSSHRFWWPSLALTNPHLALALTLTSPLNLHPNPNPNQVAAYNAALCVSSAAITRLVSNDADVREAFGGMVWVLVPHTQSRILSIAATCLFVPLGKQLLSNPGPNPGPYPGPNPGPDPGWP